jgi:type II secretory pathway predicted ATPase ExeA
MRRRVDPFGVTCDPRLYVPRLGTVAALTALRAGFAARRLVSVLSGPPGLGKTMVLQVLASELAAARCVVVPYTALDLEDLALVALDLLGEGSPAEPASRALAAYARRQPERPLALLLDDASALPVPTARAVRELADALRGALRVVAAVGDDARAAACIAALGGDVLHVRLRQPLTPPEARAYVRGRLARAGCELPDWALRDDRLDDIALEAGGVPREINTLASGVLRAQGETPAHVARVLENEPSAPQ